MKRVCVLTGASGLLGTAFIERFADQYQIVAVYNQNPVHYATQEQTFVDPLLPSRKIPENNGAVYSIRADVSNPREIDALIDEVVSRFGRIDLLVNAAAYRVWSHLLDDDAINTAEDVLKVNVLGPLRLSVGIANRFWRADPEANVEFNRNIINVSSTAGMFVYPDLGQGIYAMSKAALINLTYHLASDFWDIGIRVNAVAPDTFPGRIPTESVLEAINGFDRSDATGQVLPLYNET
ncbi:MAG TPA: SDR family oxidoreductase [Pyrinomonadaceae bacterium]|nr:SDR family oxidoreductase [Pyrinomonadaceae bacterium]